MKKILTTTIILLWASIWINAQTHQKGIRFYAGKTFNTAIEVSDRGNNAILTKEINARFPVLI